MDRRRFLTAAGAVSVVAATADLRATGIRDIDPIELSIASLQRGMTGGAFSAEGLTSAYLDRISRFDQRGPEHRSVLAVNPLALERARELDVERRSGKIRGALHGIPILVKDNIETCDPMATTIGATALGRSMRPADAPVVAKLRASGAVILGKGNLSEWGNFRSTRTISGWSGVGGQTRNAYARDRNPSGSSAGPAVAVAASFCAAAVGTESNGSILSPASLNGVVGFKPTFGLLSGRGVVPVASRQHTAGPICRSVSDAALIAAIIAEHPLGYTNRGSDMESFRLNGVRLGVMPPSKGVHPDTVRVYANARAVLQREGAIAIDLQEPGVFVDMGPAQLEAQLHEFKFAINDYLATLDPSQVDVRTLTELIEFNRSHADQELIYFGQDIFEMMETRGPLTDPAYMNAVATLHRTADVAGLATLFGQQGVDILVAPSRGPAALIDVLWGDRFGGDWPMLASAAAIAGYPSITVPAGFVGGLPVGLTLVARRNQDGFLLQVARLYERATNARVAPHLAM